MKHRKISKVLGLVIVVLAVTLIGVKLLNNTHAASAAPTYYVSSTGSDTNNGLSASTPWKTIKKVNTLCPVAGASVLFAGGQSFTDTDLEPGCSGTSAAPITYGSYGTGRPVLNNIWLNGEHDLVFNNLELDSPTSIPFNSSANSKTGAYDITLENSYIHNTAGLGVHSATLDHDWLIEGNTIEHTGDSGMLIEYSTNITITHNTIAYTGEKQASIAYATHDIYAKGPNLTISYNDLSHQMGDGQAVSMRAHGQYVYGNLIHDTPVAINFYDYDTSTANPQGTSYIYNNRVWNISQNAFYYDSQSSTGVVPSVNMVIANNTFVNNSASSEMFNLSSVPSAAHITTVNNIFTGTYGSAYRSCATCTESNNDWFGGTSNIPKGSGDLFVNPNLSAAPNFVPQTGSPVIDHGTALVSGLSFLLSSDGQPLHYAGAAPDMGAVEAAASTTGSGGAGSGSGGTTTPPVTTPPVTTPPVTKPPVTTPPVTTPPVTVTTLPAMTVSGKVKLKPSISIHSIASVTYSIDGKVVNTTTKAPFTYSLNTAQLSTGTHSLTIKTSDTKGKITTTTQSLLVKRSGKKVRFANTSLVTNNALIAVMLLAGLGLLAFNMNVRTKLQPENAESHGSAGANSPFNVSPTHMPGSVIEPTEQKPLSADDKRKR